MQTSVQSFLSHMRNVACSIATEDTNPDSFVNVIYYKAYTSRENVILVGEL